MTQSYEQLDVELLPDFVELKSRANWDYSLMNYIESRGSFELAVAFAKLFWPDFTEYRGCIVRADGFSKHNFDEWWERANGDRTKVERVLNLLHVRELVPSDTSALDESVYRYLGETLAAMWASRVRLLFPSRALIVRYEESDEKGNAVEPTLYLYEEHKD
ncbi:MAG TPA: hypothetical protein VF118_05160 [Gemmatimonadaceae bacterium]